MAAALIAAFVVIGIAAFLFRLVFPTEGGAGHPRSASAPHYVGMAACAGCHQAETDAWRGSQHAQAMQPATPDTVLGRFDGTSFRHEAITSTFFRRDKRYFVRTDGPDGKLADFEVKYTFGVFPLQQYLVEFPGGRMQALSIAWDSRPQTQGGARWFHLYPNEAIDFRDPLHWTRPAQNWNYMCADCHSTALRRNYDPKSNRYATTWKDIDVGCEACHGPGSNHVAWAEKRPGNGELAHKGLAIALDERHGMTWTVDPATGNGIRSASRSTHREIDTCAVCHARRMPIGTEPGPTGDLLDTHDPALLREGLYFADGQQQDEVYIWGSFLQSRMYARGVTCSDCHEPHSQKLRAPGNAMCASCHSSARYDVPAHTLHAPGSAGAECVACHMPQRTYMVIDRRRDHSLRVPRPDLTVRYGVPNACNGCHRKESPRWAAAAIEAAFGPQRKGFQTWTDAFAAARAGAPGAADALAAVAKDAAVPAIARATAVAEMARFPGRTLLEEAARSLGDSEPLVRAAALDALDAMPPATRAPLVDRATSDPVRLVRIKAGRLVAGAPAEGVAPEVLARREQAFAEYVASQEAVAERAEARVNLGTAFAERGDASRAESEYRAAIRLQADYVPAYVNLADLYRATGRDTDAGTVLDEGLKAAPNDPSLLHALALLRVRQKRLAEALPLFRRAAEGQPGNARFAYVWAVALRSSGQRAESLAVLANALKRSPNDRELLYALAAFNGKDDHRAAAAEYARRFIAVAADDARAPQLAAAFGLR